MRLKYHQAIVDLLGLHLEPSADRLALLRERETACGARLPESVCEWYSLESAERLFYENSNQDSLVELSKLGDPAETAQGYLRVANENQGVVAWYVRLSEGVNPPVYDNQDQWDEDLSTVPWQENSKTFTNFVFDMVASHHLRGWTSGLHLEAEDRMPTNEELDQFRHRFQEGPVTDGPDSKVYRFFQPHGLLIIQSATPQQRAASLATWSVQADSLEELVEMGKTIWKIGNLSKTLSPRSYREEVGFRAIVRLRAWEMGL